MLHLAKTPSKAAAHTKANISFSLFHSLLSDYMIRFFHGCDAETLLMYKKKGFRSVREDIV